MQKLTGTAKRDWNKVERLLAQEEKLFGKPGSERIGQEICQICARWGW